MPFLPYSADYRYTRTPWATIGLLVANVALFPLPYYLPRLTDVLMMRPSEPLPWQFITSLFLHAGFWHLAGNLFYLGVVCRYFEERLGSWHMLTLYLLFGAVANWAFVLCNIGSDVPALGASGAIAGMLGMGVTVAPLLSVNIFAARFSMDAAIARTSRSLPLFDKWPMLLIASFFICTQFLYLIIGMHGVAVSAHLAGFGFGCIMGRVLRRENLKPYGWYLDPNQDDDSEVATMKKLEFEARAALIRYSLRKDAAEESPR